jgi:peptidoglycan lytic transglycosylase D
MSDAPKATSFAAWARNASIVGVIFVLGACAQTPLTGTVENAPRIEEPAPQIATPPPEAVMPVQPVQPSAPEPSIQAKPVETPPANVWVRIRKGFVMSNLDNSLVRDWERWYSSRPDYVARMVERSSRVLFHVIEEVERRNMPAEIALLPMIESAYNPQAYSRAHASGMWQFIPSTGKLYGLQQNWWYDGRRDIVAATNAALDYLEKLYGMFSNWELALASYNWGEGAVSRAVARNQARGLPADYESLNMPNETRNYLPKLQAVKNIVSDPARFGLTLADIPNESYFAAITTPRHIDVELAARFAEIPVEEFRFLNPAHNRPVINANAAETIVLPKNKVDVFQRNIARHSEPLVSWHAYTVKPGERIEKIAATHGMSVAELKRVNHIGERQRIATGQPLLVPVKAGTKLNMPDLPAPALAKSRIAKTRYVPKSRRDAGAQKTVQRGTLAKKGKPTKATLKSAKATPGKKAKVAAPGKSTPSAKERLRIAENR